MTESDSPLPASHFHQPPATSIMSMSSSHVSPKCHSDNLHEHADSTVKKKDTENEETPPHSNKRAYRVVNQIGKPSKAVSAMRTV